MRVRLEDVARAAGVSPKTVSRVLNDEANVRGPTREKVLAAMAAMDYRPHPSARSLASNRSFLVATLYDNPSSNYLTEIQAGVLDACDEHHYSMMVRPLQADADDFVERVDALIAAPSARRPGADAADHRPSAVAGAPARARCALRQRVADRARGDHRRVHGRAAGRARNDGQPAGAGASPHRPCDRPSRAWRQSAGDWPAIARRWQRRALPYDPALVVEGDFSFGSGVAAARTLFSLPNAPTAVFAANDDMAAGVIWAAGEHGLSVPRDVSVCGSTTPRSRARSGRR